MRVIQDTHTAGERVIALGTFDGVHRGHSSLIRSAKKLAEEMEIPLRVCTFNRHPLEVLRPAGTAFDDSGKSNSDESAWC